MPQDRPNLGGGLKPSNKLPTDRLPTNKLPTDRPPTNKLPGEVTRPGNKLPGTTERPTTLPGLSGRPINLPNKPERPSDRPVARPLPGDLDDFLGIHRPSRPETKPATRPNLPNNIGNNIGNNSGNNIGNNIGNKVGINNNIFNNNVVISTRPNWSNRPGVGNISNSWNNALVRPTRPINSWASLSPGRYQYWNSWGTSVRAHWSSYHYNWFGNGWWNQHYHPIGGWHYYWYHQSLPVAYWWRRPTYAAVTSWFVWTAPPQVWQTPIYYDYGTGGNVYYEDNSVYIGGQAIGTREDFAASAAVLATVEPPADETAAENAEWMPLGTFAVTSDRRETKPTRSIQLAVNRDGVVSGTFYNESTDQAQTVLGQVDRDTQRVALRIGENEDVIVETGLYNLTQDETPVLVHFGAEKNETWLFVRLDAPEDASDGGANDPSSNN
jgi:hypothetical protein